MNKRIEITFLLLVLTQALHSTEEYFGRLWEVFLPAEFVSKAVSNNPEKGFIIINFGLVIFGLWCWLFPIRKNYSFASVFIWFWMIIEMVNGIVHPLVALYRRGYFPGVATAPVLFVLAVYLLRQLLYSGSKK